LHNARSALKSSCLDEQQRRELGCLDAYRRHDLSLMTSHGSQAYGVGMHHADQRLLPAAGLGLPPPGADDIQVPPWVFLCPLTVPLSCISTCPPSQCRSNGRLPPKGERAPPLYPRPQLPSFSQASPLSTPDL
jgi:hypothetical protein